jgi:8-oxo-dGTP pyrophosphatase MutT (NUDIX family)
MLHVKQYSEPLQKEFGNHYAFQSLCFRGRRSTPKKSDMAVRETKQEPRPKIYGGILCTNHSGKKEYALVQGRHTGKWSFPKGHSNEGETPMECTKREIWEETGIENLPDPVEYLRVGYGYYYLFILPSKYNLFAHDTNEIMKTAWVSIDDMDSLELNADVNQYIRNERRNRITHHG